MDGGLSPKRDERNARERFWFRVEILDGLLMSDVNIQGRMHADGMLQQDAGELGRMSAEAVQGQFI